MYIAIGVLIIILSILLTLIVVIQNPKGGMLSSSFGSMGNQIIGANRSTETVEKFTWYLAAALLAVSVLSIMALPAKQDAKGNVISTEKSEIEEAIKNNRSTPVMPSAPMPSAPTPSTQPANGTAPATPPTTPAPAAK